MRDIRKHLHREFFYLAESWFLMAHSVRTAWSRACINFAGSEKGIACLQAKLQLKHKNLYSCTPPPLWTRIRPPQPGYLLSYFYNCDCSLNNWTNQKRCCFSVIHTLHTHQLTHHIDPFQNWRPLCFLGDHHHSICEFLSQITDIFVWPSRVIRCSLHVRRAQIISFKNSFVHAAQMQLHQNNKMIIGTQRQLQSNQCSSATISQAYIYCFRFKKCNPISGRTKKSESWQNEKNASLSLKKQIQPIKMYNFGGEW